jgi:hypothetical protein
VTHAVATLVALLVNAAFGGHDLDLHVRPLVCAGPVCSARASVATTTYLLGSDVETSVLGRCVVYVYVRGPRRGEAELDLASCRPIERSSIVVVQARRRGL